ncbi:MAG: serine hydrolase domain-containing protein [Bryobacterales bacterium]
MSAGLLVVRDGKVIWALRRGNTPSTRWVSYSVAKSVTFVLVGAAIQDGYIESVDEPVTAYLPRMKGSAYDRTSIRNLMRMASGVEWKEIYDDPSSDVYIDNWGSLFVQRYLAHKRRVAPAGKLFNYNTAETNLVGTLLRAVATTSRRT